MRPLQLTVVAAEGLSPQHLAAAITEAYHADGRSHTARVSRGMSIDGMPVGYILVERTN